MEGHLLKWIGYLSGWQTKYFVLNSGELSVYESKEGANNGRPPSESYHISLCEITVNKVVKNEWELRLPHHAPVYLRSETYEERQSWLRTLGSVKACMMNTSSLTYVKKVSERDKIETLAKKGKVIPVSEVPKSNKQQIIANHHENFRDTMIDNLSIRNEVSEARPKSSTPKHKFGDDFDKTSEILKQEISILQEMCSSNETPDAIHERAKNLIHLIFLFSSKLTAVTGKPLDLGTLENGECTTDEQNSDLTIDSGIENSCTDPPASVAKAEPNDKIMIKTIFFDYSVTFAEVDNDAEMNADPNLICSVKTQLFLDALSNYIEIFDVFGGTLFSPLKADNVGNHEKVSKCLAKNPTRYIILQNIIDDEVTASQHKDPNSCTQAVLWLLRGMRTFAAFFQYSCSPINEGYRSSSKALEIAYTEHLKRFHNWIVQKMFIMGFKMLPSFENFINQVLKANANVNNADVEKEVMNQSIRYSRCMFSVIARLEKIYIHHTIPLTTGQEIVEEEKIKEEVFYGQVMGQLGLHRFSSGFSSIVVSCLKE